MGDCLTEPVCVCTPGVTCDVCLAYETGQRRWGRGFGGRPTRLGLSAKCGDHHRFTAGCPDCQAANRIYYVAYRALRIGRKRAS